MAKKTQELNRIQKKKSGLASDSFKRACVNWGIGRKLYSAPFIWITSSQCTIKKGANDKLTVADSFSVCHIEYDDKKIISLAIVNNKTGEVVFEWSIDDYNMAIGKDKLDTIKSLKLDAEKAKEVLKSFGYEKSADIKIKDFAKVFKALKEIA